MALLKRRFACTTASLRMTDSHPPEDDKRTPTEAEESRKVGARPMPDPITVTALLLPLPARAKAAPETVDGLFLGSFQGVGFHLRPQAENVPTARATGHGVVSIAVGHNNLGAAALETFKVNWNEVVTHGEPLAGPQRVAD